MTEEEVEAVERAARARSSPGDPQRDGNNPKNPAEGQ